MNNQKNVTKRETGGALATTLFEADADKGIQNIGQDDLALPFLKVLGHLSPEVNEKNAKYVKGAKPGMIYNSVTSQLYNGGEGLEVIPCYYKRQYVEWQDRGESMGAPVAIHEVGASILKTVKRDKLNKDRLPSGNYLENTASEYVLVLGDSPSTAIITMKATQLKTSRKWNSLISGIKMQGKNSLFTPARYSHIYILKTVQMSNDKGTWFGWDVNLKGGSSETARVQDTSIYETAKKFSERLDTSVQTKPKEKISDTEI